MINYNPVDAFGAATIYDLGDLVQGGMLGASNGPLKELFNRTLYLLNRMNKYADVKPIPGAYTFDPVNDLFKSFEIIVSANTTFALPDVTAIPKGIRVPISTVITGIKAVTVQCYGSQSITAGTSNYSQLYMHDAERLCLVSAGDHWVIELADGNFFNAGQVIYSRRVEKNTIIAQGQKVNRQDMPRISAYADSLPMNQAIVPTSTWQSGITGNPDLYKGCYYTDTGLGVTTVGLPDERAMTVRALDLGRGIDGNRIHNYPGGYQGDFIKKMNVLGGNGVNVTGNNTVSSADSNIGAGGEFDLTKSFALTAGDNVLETTIKNIGKIPLILY